ncbi:hypothetical protein UY3_02305 [Chelonia mydas]|uniref:Uncharacterized protein n=1 Tax=Chelonia mydas TaxID=8469 RepID=M7BXC0_CHEMY|nr:hypothetical protein UY3_02305 [Chelonia mydas]
MTNAESKLSNSRESAGKSGMRTAPRRTHHHPASFMRTVTRCSILCQNTDPAAVHDSLVSRDGDLLTLKSNIALEGSQQTVDQASKVTLMLIPVPKEALPMEQLLHVLDPNLEEFDDPQEEQLVTEQAAETDEAEVAPEPALEGSQQTVDQASKVTLMLIPVPKEALPMEQLPHVLDPNLQEFDDPHEEQLVTEQAAKTDEAEVAPEPVFRAYEAAVRTYRENSRDRNHKVSYTDYDLHLGLAPLNGRSPRIATLCLKPGFWSIRSKGSPD